jgi:hypothetical protein
MSVGTGIFLSALVFAFLILCLFTRDRWHWRRAARWSLVTAGSFALLVALGVVGAFVYEKVRNMPRKQTAYAELVLGMTMPEVKYVKGYPPHVVKDAPKEPDPKDVWWQYPRVLDTLKDLKEGQHIEDYSTWTFDQDNQNFRIDVDFNVATKTVNKIACYSQKAMSCPPLIGIDDGMSEETIIERLGKPSHQHLDGVTREIEYKDLGVWFYLTKKTIYMMGVKDFGSSKGD